ncbi:MAG: hypothetical protein V3R29_07310, partial [Candidatus Acidoferrales bacterium]
LGELGDRRAMPALEEFAASELERRLQREAEIALRKIRGEQKSRRAAEPPTGEPESPEPVVESAPENTAPLR